MRRRFALHLRVILWAFIILFVVSIFLLAFVFSGGGRGLERQAQQQQEFGPQNIAEVNGRTLERPALDRAYRQIMQIQSFYGPLNLAALSYVRTQALEQAISTELESQAAAAASIKVPDSLVDQQIDQAVKANIKQLHDRFKAQALDRMRQVMEQSGKSVGRLTERAYAEWFAGLIDREAVRQQLAIERLQQSVTAGIKVDDRALEASYRQVTFNRLLVNLRTGSVTRTEAQAKSRADQLLTQAKGGADFVALIKKESDDEPEFQVRGGQIGPVGYDTLSLQWSPEFAKAVTSTAPGEMVGPLKTSQGFQIVKVTKIETNRPADFAKRKEEYRKTLVQTRQNAAWSAFYGSLRDKAKIKVTDHELLGYQALAVGKTDTAIEELEASIDYARKLDPEVGAAIYFTLGSLYQQKKDYARAADYFDQALSVPAKQASLLSGYPTDVYWRLAEIARARHRTDDLVTNLKAVSDSAQELTDQNLALHIQLMTEFEQLGQKDLVAGERQWMADYASYKKEQAAKEAAAQVEQSKPAAPAPKPAPAPSR